LVGSRITSVGLLSWGTVAVQQPELVLRCPRIRSPSSFINPSWRIPRTGQITEKAQRYRRCPPFPQRCLFHSSEGTDMSSSRMSHPTGFSPGEHVKIIDGTFAGMNGVVVSIAEARMLWEKVGGQQPPPIAVPGTIWLVLSLFNRAVPIC